MLLTEPKNLWMIFTADSDSVCEGSNPSPAAKKTLSLCWEFFLFSEIIYPQVTFSRRTGAADEIVCRPGFIISTPLPGR